MSELAEIIVHPAYCPDVARDAMVQLVIRRIRNWTVVGALKPIGDPHSGTGKHRMYDNLALYQGAVLNALADNNQVVGVLIMVAKTIMNLWGPEPLIAGAAEENWQKALSGKERIYMVVSSVAGTGSGISLYNQKDLAGWMQTRAAGTFVNLTLIFSRLP